MKRRVLALMLAGCMVFTQVPCAFAAEEIAAEAYAEEGIAGDEDASVEGEQAADEQTPDGQAAGDEEYVFFDAEADAEGDTDIAGSYDEEYDEEDADAEWNEEGETLVEEAEEIALDAENTGDFDKAVPDENEAGEELAEAGIASATLTLEKTSALVNEDVGFSISAVGGQIANARVWNDEGDDWWWFYSGDLDDDGVLRSTVSWGGERPHLVYAEVTFEPWNDEWGDDHEDTRTWIRTSSATIDVTKYGDVGEFSITLSSDTIPRGENLSVDFTSSKHADRYWVDIDKWNGDKFEWYEWYGDIKSAGKLEVPTGFLEPGRYQVRGQASGLGYEGHESEEPVEFTVTDPDLPERGILFTVSDVAVDTGEDIRFTVFAPGATNIQVFYDYDDNKGWHDWSGGRDYYEDWQSYGHSGFYKMVARAYFSDDENDYEENSETIEVFASKGESIELEYPEGLPAYLKKGDALNFTVKKPAKAKHLDVEVYYDWDEECLFEKHSNSDINVTISAKDLARVRENTEVRIEIDAQAEGYDSGHEEYRLIMLAPSSKVSLSLGADKALVNEDVALNIKVNDSREVKGVQIWNDDGGNWDWRDPDFSTDGTAIYNFGWWNTGRHTAIVQVTFDDYNDAWGDEDQRTWITSNPQTIDISQIGEVGKFSVSISGKSVERGKPLTVTFTEAANADHYWVDVEKWNDERGDWDWFDSFAHTNYSGKVSLGTAEFEPGSYQLFGMANGVGYHGHEAENGPIEFTVLESGVPEGKVSLEVDKTRIDTGEDFYFSVVAPAAEWIEVFYDYENNDRWTGEFGGEFVDGYQGYGQSGTYKILARAHYVKDGVEVKTVDSALKTVTVKASKSETVRGYLPDSLPSYIQKGDSLTFTVVKPEKAEGMNIDIGFGREEGYTDLYHSGYTRKDSVNVSIPAKVFEDLPSELTIDVDMNIYAPGYEMEGDHRNIPVLSPAADEFAISVDKKYVLPGETANVTVTPKDNTFNEIMINENGGYWEYEDEEGYWHTCVWTPEDLDEKGNIVVQPGTEDERTINLYARGTYDDEDADQRKWYTTEAVTIIVADATADQKKEADALKAEIAKLTADDAAVTAAEKKFDALTPGQKAYLGDALTTMSDQLSTARAAVNADKEEAGKAVKLISALKENPGLADETAVKEADAAYNALTPAQKKYVDSSLVKKLENAKASVQKAKDEKAKADAKTAMDNAVAKAVSAANAAKANPTATTVKTAEDAIAEANKAISAAAALGVDTTAAKSSVATATSTASEAKKAAEEKETTIKVSKTTVKKGKKATIKITADSGAKVTVKAKNKNAKNKKYVSKVKSGKTAKITFTKNAKKGKYTFTVTAPKNGQYKAVTKTITIKVK